MTTAAGSAVDEGDPITGARCGDRGPRPTDGTTGVVAHVDREEGPVSGHSGGVGNEAGSVHRRGVAMLLAVYGLVGRELPAVEGAAGPVPDRLEFETDQPTDDLTCVAKNGVRMLISAKRSV